MLDINGDMLTAKWETHCSSSAAAMMRQMALLKIMRDCINLREALHRKLLSLFAMPKANIRSRS